MQLTLPGRCFWPCFLFASIPFIPFIPIDSLRKFLLFYPSRDDPEIFCKDESRWKTPLKAPHSLRDFIFVVDTIVVFFFFTYADYPIVFLDPEELHPQPWHCASCYLEATASRRESGCVQKIRASHGVVVCFFVFLSSAKDIKLENFMYARKDTDHLKLIDFGLSVMAFCWKKAPWFKTRLTPLEAKSGSPIPKWKLPVAPWATLPPRLDDVFLAKAFEFELGNAKMKAEGIWVDWDDYLAACFMLSWNPGILVVCFNEQCSCYTSGVLQVLNKTYSSKCDLRPGSMEAFEAVFNSFHMKISYLL